MKQRAWRWNEVGEWRDMCYNIHRLVHIYRHELEACDAKGGWGITFKCHGDITCKTKSNDPCQQIKYEQWAYWSAAQLLSVVDFQARTHRWWSAVDCSLDPRPNPQGSGVRTKWIEAKLHVHFQFPKPGNVQFRKSPEEVTYEYEPPYTYTSLDHKLRSVVLL